MRYVYILQCADGTYYTGITNDITKRIFDHNNSKIGAKYTKSRRPVQLVWKKRMKDKVLAMKLERKIKRLPREEKQKIIEHKKKIK